jgi:hypothetical protein
MSHGSVSQRTVCLVAICLAVVLYLPLMPLEDALLRPLNLPPHRRLPVLIGVTFVLSIHLLVPAALSILGLRGRGRSVERLRVADPGKGGDVAIDPPVRIRHGKLLFLTVAAIWGSVGLFLLAISWPPPQGSFTNYGVVVGGVCLVVGLILALVPAPTLCEINEAGIRAPGGSFGLRTFVPWEEITHCEIVHDEKYCWSDYFILRDRSGRPRFRDSAVWLGQLRELDRARIFHALRTRFPRGDGPAPHAKAASARHAASPVWDRELDG